MLRANREKLLISGTERNVFHSFTNTLNKKSVIMVSLLVLLLQYLILYRYYYISVSSQGLVGKMLGICR